MGKVTVCIPARLASSRLPGKLLLAQTGKTVLQHTCEAAHSQAGNPIVITPDVQILAAVPEAAWAKTIFKPESDRPHYSGTSRISECLTSYYLEDSDLIINVQADEPTLPAGAVDRLIAEMERNREAEVGTITCPIHDWDLPNPAVVKCAVGLHGNALYFSRAAIAGAVKHVGVYAYRRKVLAMMRQVWLGKAEGDLSRAENLEQLFFLEMGWKIATIHLDESTIAIDTADDYRLFCDWYARKQGDGWEQGNQSGSQPSI